MRTILSLTVAGLAAAATTAAAAEKAPGETVIPFVNSISNVEWKAASADSLYVRGGKGEWYFVRTTNRCNRLRQALGIGFQTSALGQLDRNGAILVQGVRCPVASIDPSDGPPETPRHRGG
ncbi:MAG: hypothetical protein QOG72_2073 [Sphingomonadales bacterium]|jgi:hypothetical protein|nr:hypothetical protein [Sphingomonadales bacterium]